MTEIHALPARPCILGESALWDPLTGLLHWLDLTRPKLNTYDPEARKWRAVDLNAQPPLGGLVLGANDEGLVLVSREGIRTCSPDGQLGEVLLNPVGTSSRIGYNDAAVDRSGQLWFGTIDLAEQDQIAGLSRIEGEESILEVSNLVISNGPAFSPDGRVLYLSDTAAGRVLACEIAASGTLLKPVVHLSFPPSQGLPDGLTVDSEGALWVAHWGSGSVTRHAPDGELLLTYEIPTPNVTSLAFGGQGLDSLFVTTARHPEDGGTPDPASGLTYVFTPGPRGIPSARWAGGK